MSKMKNCKTCSAEIAISEKSCPKCGAKNKKPIWKQWWVWILVVSILFAAIGGLGDSSNVNDTISPATEDVVIDSSDLATKIVDDAINKFNLDKSCANVIFTNIPNAETIIDITQDAAFNYHIYMNDGTIYLMSIFAGGDNIGCVARITTNEKDVENRTILYNANETVTIQ